MDRHRLAQPHTALSQPLPGSWYFSYYFSPPTLSAGTRAVVVGMTT